MTGFLELNIAAQTLFVGVHVAQVLTLCCVGRLFRRSKQEATKSHITFYYCRISVTEKIPDLLRTK